MGHHLPFRLRAGLPTESLPRRRAPARLGSGPQSLGNIFPTAGRRETRGRAVPGRITQLMFSALVSTSFLHPAINWARLKLPMVRPSRSFTLTVALLNSCSPTTRM